MMPFINITLRSSANAAELPFSLLAAALRMQLDFRCGLQAEAANQSALPPWTAWRTAEQTSARLVAECAAGGVWQRVTVEVVARGMGVVVRHCVGNALREPVRIHSVVTVDGRLKVSEPLLEAGYIHSLNVRHDLHPLTPLEPHTPSIMLGRVNFLFFEGLAISLGAGRPAVVTGPVSQRVVHRCQQLEWDGAAEIAVRTEQDLRGIEGKLLPAEGTLELDAVYVGFQPEFEANEVFVDYLAALRAETPTRWERNPLRKEHFFDPWNNFLYWEASEKAILETAKDVKRDFPTVAWMGLDDGYQKAWVAPTLACLPNGELDYDYNKEVIWWKNCPGVSFGFSEGLGEDQKKFPSGLLTLAQSIKDLGLRPKLWVGMEISIHHPLCQTRPDWFHVAQNGDHALLDISVPEVREEVERVFRTYFGRHGWEALKIDFWSHLFERSDLKFSQGNLTAAEWRAWFFQMLRRHVPNDGFITLGCDVAMGGSWVAEWVDSYRCSNDMRDGDWENVKGNVMMSMVPTLTNDSGEPIADGDTLSIFKRLSAGELQCWADYIHQTGGLVEQGGNPSNWTAEHKEWMRAYLDEPRGGGRAWFGDAAAWGRDGLPAVVYRASGDDDCTYVVTLHNWTDNEMDLKLGGWSGPVRSCRDYLDTRTGEQGKLTDGPAFRLPARSSRRLRVW